MSGQRPPAGRRHLMIIRGPQPPGLSRRSAMLAAGAGLATPGLAPRVLQNALQAALGQPVPIENRGGAGGNIATEQVLRARPDGYTLCVGNVGTFVLNPHTMPGMTFDPLELVPIGLMPAFGQRFAPANDTHPTLAAAA